MIVVDASVLVIALLDEGSGGDDVREMLRTEHLAAPELIDLEVASALRRLKTRAHIDDKDARLALTDLFDLPVVLGHVCQFPAGSRGPASRPAAFSSV